MITKCPHCSGTSGYAYSMKVTHEMLGEWGQQAESGDSTTTTVSLAQCIDCRSKLTVKTARGTDQPKQENQQ